MSTLLGLGGKLRAGKDEVANYLAEHHEFSPMGMSDALNEALQRIGPEGPWVRLDRDAIIHRPWERGIRRGKYGSGEFVRYGELLKAVGYVEAKDISQDVREYLQGLGTEVGREMIDREVWVNIAEKRIKALLAEGKNVVITAVRFPNELEMVRRLGGTTIWIERSSEARGAGEDVSKHASENSVQLEDFDWIIPNEGTLENLFAATASVLDVVERAQEQEVPL